MRHLHWVGAVTAVALATSTGTAWGQSALPFRYVYEAPSPAEQEADLCRILHFMIFFGTAGRTVCSDDGPHKCCAAAPMPTDPKCKPGSACS